MVPTSKYWFKLKKWSNHKPNMKTEHNIKLLLVDDHDVVRTGLKSFLQTQPGLEVVGEASNGLEAIASASTLCPDVILMDITMPEMDGMEATRQLVQNCSKTRVLVLTVHEDKQFFFEMIAAGASGYVTKQTAADELVAAIHAVADGNVYLQPALAKWLLEDYRRLNVINMAESHHRAPTESEEPTVSDLDVLSQREQQVVELVAEGLTTPQIAEQLELSPKTISRHRERIMKKLGLHSSAQLVKFAIRTGLIDL